MTLNNVCSISRKGKKKAVEFCIYLLAGVLHCWDCIHTICCIWIFSRGRIAKQNSASVCSFSLLHFISNTVRKCLVKCEMPTFRWPLFLSSATFGICHALIFLSLSKPHLEVSKMPRGFLFSNFIKYSLLISPPPSNIAEALVSKGLATVIRYRQDDDQRSSHYDELLAAEARWE